MTDGAISSVPTRFDPLAAAMYRLSNISIVNALLRLLSAANTTFAEAAAASAAWQGLAAAAQ